MPQSGYIIVMDKYPQTATGMYNSRFTYRLPPWMTYPVEVWGSTIFNQSSYGKMPAPIDFGPPGGPQFLVYDYSALLTMSVDRRSMYTRQSKYPLAEATLPIATTPIGEYSAADGKVSNRIWLGAPTTYNEGDRIVVGVEGYATGQIVYPFINLYVASDAVSPCPENVVLALYGKDVSGANVAVDYSWSNHQPRTYDVTIPNDAPYPAAPAPMTFNGTSSWIEFRHTRDDFDWPGAFKIKTRFKTSDASASGGQWRALFFGASGTLNAINEPITPIYVTMDTSGAINIGALPGSPHLVGPAGYADGVTHELEIERTAGHVLTMKIDGVAVAGPVTDTRHYRPAWPRIGRSMSGGYWNGEISGFTVERN